MSALAQDALVWLIVGAAALYAAARLGLERLRTRVEALRVTHDGAELAFTLSAGVVEHSPAEPLVEAIARADRALYQAKQQGRNRVVAG